MIIPGLVSATFKTASPNFVLAALKKADLHAVEWSENWHIPAGDTALARDLRAVSYTHLDVYKRQTIHCVSMTATTVCWLLTMNSLRQRKMLSQS